MFRNTLNKQADTDKLNKKIRRIKRATEIEDITSLKNFNEILSENPHRAKIQGYYVEIPLSEYQTFVPNGVNFTDRYGKQFKGGQFDAPLLRLDEWREKWQQVNQKSAKPDLLVNANWFNVWDSGIPNQGVKINPRIQDRTYLIGLSISDGELVSTHKVLDQNDIGLDTILFDTENNAAAMVEHENIDVALNDDPDYYENKNAVSGFIILNDGVKQKTPDLNNSQSIRLPRTGIGYKNGGKNIVIMVIHNTDRTCGVTADEFANLFAEFGCTHAINLDNSGSAALYYKGLGEFGKKFVTVQTKSCDVEQDDRPKPNCLGFKNVSKCSLFAYDDFDVPAKKQTSTNVKPSTNNTDENLKYNFRS